MSGELVPINSDQLEGIEKVASLKLTGKTDYAIARELAIPQKVVKERFALWKDMVQADNDTRDIARDHLNQMVVHYDKLISESYELLADLKEERFGHQIAAQINATLKNISDYEARRVDALQKAGLLDNTYGDQMAELERKQKILVDILRNDLCKVCAPHVKRRLIEVTGVVEGTVVHDSDEDG